MLAYASSTILSTTIAVTAAQKKEEEEEAMLFMGWSYLASVPITCSVYYYILILNRNCH